MSDYEIFDAGDVVLQKGATLRDAKLAYKTFGTLNAKKDNVIIQPTWYSGHHTDVEWTIGEDQALDPRQYFIIVPNMLGNGLSSSPSNTPAPYDKARFPGRDGLRQRAPATPPRHGGVSASSGSSS